MKIVTTIFLSLIIPLYSNCQSFHQQQRQLATYNIIFNAGVAAIGSVIHKHEHETICNAFISGAIKGAVGGAIIFIGKKSVALIPLNKDLRLAHISKSIHALGSSMVSNGSLNKPILSTISFELYTTRLDVNTDTWETKIRLQPFALIGGIIFAKYTSLNIKKSLEYGGLYFDSDSKKYRGRCYLCGVIVSSTSNHRHNTAAHELIHVMQNREYLVFNNYYSPIKNKKISKYIYLDIPIYAGFSMLAKTQVDKNNRFKTYYRHFYEFEASSFGYLKEINRSANNIY